MIGEQDVTVTDRAITLVKAAGFCVMVIIAAALFAALFGSVVQQLSGG